MLVFNLIAGISGVILLFAVFLNELRDKEYASVMQWESEVDMATIRPQSPAKSFFSKSYNFGRFRTPIEDMNLHDLTNSQRFAQKKEFVWTAVSDGEWLVGSALLQFGYTTGAIVYAYNSLTNETFTTHLEIPIASMLGATFSPGESTTASSAVSGCANWTALGLQASKCFNPETQLFEVDLNGKSKQGGTPYHIQYSFPMSDQSTSLVFPLGARRASVVTKMGGTEATASIQIGEKSITLKQPLGLMDYTRGLLRRVTVWHWLSTAWRDAATGARLGLQLSEGTYDNSEGVSLESTLWVDGTAHHIASKVVYTQLDKSVAPHQSQWTVATADASVSLVFTPADVIVGDFHYYILDGNLFHIWGTYSGRVTAVTEDGTQLSYDLLAVPGVLEDHYAVW